MKRTKEEIKEFYKKQREQWKKAKEAANVDEITAIINNHGLKISVSGYAFVSYQMEALGLDGIPYLDVKTYGGWKENGFQVKKGEKSQLHGITWVDVQKQNDDLEEKTNGYKMTKVYNLFHRSQVGEI